MEALLHQRIQQRRVSPTAYLVKMRKGSASFGFAVSLLLVGNLFFAGQQFGASSFVTAFQMPVTCRRVAVNVVTTTPRFLSSSPPPPPEEDMMQDSSVDKVAASSTNAMETKQMKEDSPSYPLDVPSPILLASSMVIAIASTGTLKGVFVVSCRAVTILSYLGKSCLSMLLTTLFPVCFLLCTTRFTL